MTALGDHAAAEMLVQGITGDDYDNILNIVGTFASYTDPVEFNAILEKVNKLLRFEPLSPLTDVGTEWQDRYEQSGNVPLWQSKRWLDAWTRDPSFATYFRMSEAGDDGGELYPTDHV